MLTITPSLNDNKWLARFALFAFVSCFITAIYYWLSIENAVGIMLHLLAPITFALAGTWLFTKRFISPVLILSFIFPLWYALSRILHGDLFLNMSNQSFVSYCMIYWVIFPYVFTLNMASRKRFTRIFAFIFVAFFSILSWLAIIGCTSGTPFSIAHYGRFIRIDDMFEKPARLNVLGIHPNIQGCSFSVCFTLAIYLFASCKRKKLWLVPYIIVEVGFYFAIALTMSRTVMVNTAFVCAMSVLLLMVRHLRIKQPVIKCLFIAATACMIAFSAYLGYDVAVGIMTRAANGRLDEASSLVLKDATAEAALQQAILPDETENILIKKRDIRKDIGTLTGRTDIYKSVITTIKAHPEALAIGLMEDSMMDTAAQSLNRTLYHFHNAFLQTLVLTGLPGLGIILAITFILLKAIWQIMFARNASSTFADQVLTLVPIIFLIQSMLEPFAFVNTTSIAMQFMVCAAIAITRAKEIESQQKEMTRPV